jgi:hypothetical protein
MFYLNRPRLKPVGPIAPARCHACGEEGWARLHKRRNWVTFFSFPLLPVSGATYEVVCPHCLNRKPIRGEDVDRAKEQVQRTEELTRGELPWEDYAATVEDFSDAVSEDVTAPAVEDDQPRGFA